MVNDAVAILEERYSDLRGQVDRVGAFDTLAQLQLVDDELCAAVSLRFSICSRCRRTVCLSQFVAGKVTGVGGGAGELHALEVHFDVAVGRRRQRVAFVPKLDGGVAVQPCPSVRL